MFGLPKNAPTVRPAMPPALENGLDFFGFGTGNCFTLSTLARLLTFARIAGLLLTMISFFTKSGINSNMGSRTVNLDCT
jgi:hypothetical protein